MKEINELCVSCSHFYFCDELFCYICACNFWLFEYFWKNTEAKLKYKEINWPFQIYFNDEFWVFKAQ